MLGFKQHSHAVTPQDNSYSDDLLPAFQSALAALADIDLRYDLLQEHLTASIESKEAAERILQQLRDQKNDECGPIHERLAELQKRAVWAAAHRDKRSLR
jgi:hypothetical protein